MINFILKRNPKVISCNKVNHKWMVKGGLFHVAVKTQSTWLCPLSLSFCNFLRDTSSLSLASWSCQRLKAIKVNNIWTEPQQVVNEWGYHSTTINFPLSGRRCQILKKVSFSLESWESHTIRISTKNGGVNYCHSYRSSSK